MTNASQPNTAVFQWLALQRPMRAAMLLDFFKVDISWAARSIQTACGKVPGASHRAEPRAMRRAGVLRCGYPHPRRAGSLAREHHRRREHGSALAAPEARLGPAHLAGRLRDEP